MTQTVYWDIGTQNSRAYALDLGVFVQEDSFVAFDANTQEVFATGSKAYDLYCKKYNGLVSKRLVKEGVFCDEAALFLYLKEKMKSHKKSVFQKLRAVVCVADDCPLVCLSAARRAFRKAGFSEVVFFPCSVCIAIYDDPKFLDYAVLDMGAGAVQITLFNNHEKIYHGVSKFAGNKIDAALRKAIWDQFNLRVGAIEAKTIKHALSSRSRTGGQNIRATAPDGSVVTQVVDNDRLRPVLESAWEENVAYFLRILETMPRNYLNLLKKNGVLLSGGGCEAMGVTDRLSKSLGLTVRTVARPQYAGVLGAQRIFSAPQKYGHLQIKI